jgi:hypothetical protein
LWTGWTRTRCPVRPRPSCGPRSTGWSGWPRPVRPLLARRLAQLHRPDRAGARTAAEALARRAGGTVGAARDALDTSTRLPELPLVDAAVRGGKLSPAQAAAVSDAAAANPATEQRPLELASTASLPELREECARVRAAADPDPAATNTRLHRRRGCAGSPTRTAPGP